MLCVVQFILVNENVLRYYFCREIIVAVFSFHDVEARVVVRVVT